MLVLTLGHAREPLVLELRLEVEPSGRVMLAKTVRAASATSESSAADEAATRRALLSEGVGASLRVWLDRLGVATLEGASDDGVAPGLWACLEARAAGGELVGSRHRPPRAAALEVIALVTGVARWQPLGDLEERALLAHVDAAVRAQDAIARVPGPVGGAVEFRARSLGIDGLVVRSDEGGATARLGTREMRLSRRDADALQASVEALLRTRTQRIGAGEHLFEIERGGVRVEVRSPDVSVDAIPVAARAQVALLVGLADVLETEGDEALLAWRSRLPLLVRPVRTRDLVVRFHMRDARHGLPGERWYRLETHGTIVRCNAGSGEDEGRPIVPHEVPDDRFEGILRALEACDALGVGRSDVTPNDPWPDDDRYVELVLQRPRGDELETTIARWSYGPMAPRDRRPDAERALEAVHALYARLMKERLAADVD